MAEADALPIIRVVPYFVAPANEHVKKSGGFTNTRHSRFRACEEIGRPYKYSSFPRKRESVCGVSVRTTGPIIADNRLWIPAFERVKKSKGSHHDDRSAEGLGAVKDSNSLIILVIPAKAGIRRRSSAISARFLLRKRRKQIPAFAGMTKSSRRVRFLRTLFRGNDEYL